MKLSRTPKILIGVATGSIFLLPFLAMLLFFLPFIVMGGTAVATGEPEPAVMMVVLLIFPIMMIFAVVQMVLMIFYIAHIVLNKEANSSLLILLAVGVYMMPFFAMPAYFLIYIMPNEPPEWALEPGNK